MLYYTILDSQQKEECICFTIMYFFFRIQFLKFFNFFFYKYLNVFNFHCITVTLIIELHSESFFECSNSNILFKINNLICTLYIAFKRTVMNTSTRLLYLSWALYLTYLLHQHFFIFIHCVILQCNSIWCKRRVKSFNYIFI